MFQLLLLMLRMLYVVAETTTVAPVADLPLDMLDAPRFVPNPGALSAGTHRIDKAPTGPEALHPPLHVFAAGVVEA